MSDIIRRSTRFSMRSKQIGQLLLDNGDVTAEQVMQALEIQSQQGGMLGVILRNLGFCDESAIAKALLKQVQVTDVQCSELQVPPNVAQLVAREVCETEKLCPFELLGNLLCVVMGNPLNRRAITQIEERAHLKVKSFKCVWPKINELIQRAYPEDAVSASNDELAVENNAFSVESPVAPSIENEESVAAVREQQSPNKLLEPKIDGLDNLDNAVVEVIETNRRGLIKRQSRSADQEPSKLKIEKKAKVNVDLDTLDLSQGELIKGVADDESLEEIKQAAVTASKLLTRHGGAIVLLKLVRDSYFYAEGNAPQERSDELLDLIETLPLAEVVAQSLGEYESQVSLSSDKAQQETKTATPSLSATATICPPELQSSPIAAMAAIAISEEEFQKITATLDEDPISEWHWKYAATGPVAVLEYEEN